MTQTFPVFQSMSFDSDITHVQNPFYSALALLSMVIGIDLLSIRLSIRPSICPFVCLIVV